MRRHETPHWKRRKAKPRRPSAKPVDQTPIQVTVASVGHQGDGIALLDHASFDGVMQAFIPNTLPGEEVIITPKAVGKFGLEAELVEVVSPSPERKDAACHVADRCGGCQTQMMSPVFYQNWKRDLVKDILEPLSIAEEAWLETYTALDFGRRRARLAYRHITGGIICGFREPKSHQIIAPKGCVILNQSLLDCVDALRQHILPALALQSQGEVTITDTDQGWDITLHPEKAPSHDEIAGMINAAGQTNVTRLSIGEKDGIITPHFTKKTPTLTWTDDQGQSFTLYPASGSFLQADAGAEAVMQRDIARGLNGYHHILDLFCGSGTLSLPLLMNVAPPKSIHGYDSGEDALNAMMASAKAAEAYHRVQTTKQNLFKDPLTAREIDRFDAVIVDPPRAGAATLMPALAESTVTRVMMVSCHPKSFVRDAAVLMAQGFQCSHIRMVDQFLNTPHAELVAQFDRS